MSDAATPLLVGEELEKSYASGPEIVHVLRGASITVNAGEVVALVGASGVGKSTLLHLLGALDRPTQGRVLFEGADLFARSEAQLVRYRRHEVGFVFQFYNLLGEMSALENAMIPSLLARRPTGEARERAAEALAEVGLADRVRHRPGEMSGGEQQRILIAQALVRRPRVLLLDEPLDSLDLPNQAAVAALVARVCREHGVTVLLVAHDVNPILGYLDGVIYLGHGGAAIGPPGAVITSDTLSRLYDTRIEVLTASDGRLVVVGQPEAPAHHSDRHAH
jgi:zinc/manganese transport system ATP-binding protein